MLDQTTRTRLRAAIGEREKRRESVEKATAALARANDLLRDTEARLANLSDVEGAIAAHNAQRVKAWAASGGEKPGIDLPKNLVARRKACDETREEVTAAKAACKALADELDAAKIALAEAEHAASEATVPVMLEEGEKLSTYLVAARREVWRLEAQLRALGETWVSRREGPRAVRLSRTILDALSMQEPQYPALQRPEIKQAAAWRTFHTALLTDPEETWEKEALRDP
jgi:hypothetical protein